MAATDSVLFISAMKQEIPLLAQTLQISSLPGIKTGRAFEGEFHEISCNLLLCGVGPGSATRSIDAFLKQRIPAKALILGWAGALRDTYSTGDVLLVDTVHFRDRNPSEPLFPDRELFNGVQKALVDSGISFHKAGLVTSETEVVHAAIRDNLAATFGAGCVDMESAYLVKQLQAHRVPTVVIRAISDSADERIGFAMDQIPRKRRDRYLYFLQHPVVMKNYFNLMANLRTATQSLEKILLQVLPTLRDE